MSERKRQADALRVLADMVEDHETELGVVWLRFERGEYEIRLTGTRRDGDVMEVCLPVGQPVRRDRLETERWEWMARHGSER